MYQNSTKNSMDTIPYVSCINSECCCKCVNLKNIMCHPFNNDIGKGEVSKQLWFVCVVTIRNPFETDNCYFFENEHGSCELFIKKQTMFTKNA